MNGSIDTFKELYIAGEVQRCHTMRTLHRQSIAEHSWGVALIIAWMYDGDPPTRLLVAALTHDSPERKTGDLPAIVKWQNNELRKQLEIIENDFNQTHSINTGLTDLEEVVLTFADSVELALYCIAEVNMGNCRMAEIGERACKVAYEKRTRMNDKSLRQRVDQLLWSIGGGNQ